MVYVVSLRIHNSSPHEGLPVELGAYMAVHCNNYYDIIILDKAMSQRSILKAIENADLERSITIPTSTNRPVNFLIVDCSCNESLQEVARNIAKNHGMPLTAPFYTEGWDYHKFLCLTKRSMSSILDVIGKDFVFELLSVEEFADFNPLEFTGMIQSQILTSLSPKQLEVLIEAYNDGYYKIPRKVRLIDIAKRRQKSRHTIERTLRAAENKIIEKTIPLLDFEVRLRKKPSSS